jgi:malic enzyme
MDKPKPTPTSAHTLEKIVKGADIFLGLSTGWRVEARYDRAHGEGPTDLGAGHPDAGNQYQKTPKVPSRLDHSDRSFGYPNQVNNVLCFPFMFRGHSTRCNINEEMKSAVVPAITELTGAELSDLVATASGGSTSGVRPHYLILTPFDPRLIERIAPAVAKAAMDRGVATRLPKHVARRELALASSYVSPLSRIAQITRVHHDPAGLDRHLFTVRVATAVAFRIMSADRAGSV